MQLTYRDSVPKSVVFGWAEAKPADSTLWTIELKTTTPDANENPYSWKAWALVDTNWTISFQVPRKAGTYGFNNVSLGAMRYSSLEFNSAKPIWTSYSNGAVRITRKGADSLLIELDAQGSNAEDSTIASTISGRYMVTVVNPDTWVEP